MKSSDWTAELLISCFCFQALKIKTMNLETLHNELQKTLSPTESVRKEGKQIYLSISNTYIRSQAFKQCCFGYILTLNLEEKQAWYERNISCNLKI